MGAGVARPAALPAAGPTQAGAAKPFNSLPHRAQGVNLGFNFIPFLQLTAGRACPGLPPDATGREGVRMPRAPGTQQDQP